MQDVTLSHIQGVKAFWTDVLKFKRGATKQEYLHGFLFSLYATALLVAIAAALVFHSLSGTFSGYFSHIRSSGGGRQDSTLRLLSISTNAVLALGPVVLVVALLALASILIMLGMLSLTIRRLIATGIMGSHIAGALCLANFSVIVPILGWLVGSATHIIIMVICFIRPSIAWRGYVYPFLDVLQNLYQHPAPATPAETPTASNAAPSEPYRPHASAPSYSSGYSSASFAPEQAPSSSSVPPSAANAPHADAFPFLGVIAARCTTRQYLPEPLGHEDLEKIAFAGAQSPSSMNRQPWKIIVVSNPELLADLNQAAVERINSDPALERFRGTIAKRGGTVFYGAPHIIFLAMKSGIDAKALDSAARDVGIAVENMALAATSLGFGNCICGLAKLPFESERASEFAERIGFGEGYEFGIALLVGKSDSKGTPHQIDLGKIAWVD